MSQVTGNLTINDGAATPVARTFAPERVAPDLSTFVEKTAGVSSGYIRLGVKFSPATSNRPTNRVDFNMDLPVLSTVNGVSTVAMTARFRSYWVLPDNLSAADRANAWAFVANALDNAQIKAVIKDLDPLY